MQNSESEILREDHELIIEHARESFERLADMSLFLTGGTGFFGKWLLEGFWYANKTLKTNTRLTVLSRNPQKFIDQHPRLSEGVIFLKGDILDFNFPDGRYDYIIHAATEASARLNREHPRSMLECIVEGTRRTLDFAKSAKMRRILNISSGAVYGQQPADLAYIDEQFAGAPNIGNALSAYAEGKRIGELLGTIYSMEFGMEVVNARCFAFAGPYLDLHGSYAIGNFVRDKIEGRKIVMTGDGTPRRSYLYGADLIVWLLRILTHGQNTKAYNVGSEHWITIADLADLVDAIYDKRASVVHSRNEKIECERYVPSTKLAQTELALREYTELKTSIRKMIDWYQRKGEIQ